MYSINFLLGESDDGNFPDCFRHLLLGKLLLNWTAVRCDVVYTFVMVALSACPLVSSALCVRVWWSGPLPVSRVGL
jgi:hypothetical protein